MTIDFTGKTVLITGGGRGRRFKSCRFDWQTPEKPGNKGFSGIFLSSKTLKKVNKNGCFRY